ncbi:MAG: MarR family transcriptional regulator [Ilumatobacteraceae bacterium]
MTTTDDPLVSAYRLLIADAAELLGHSRRTSDHLARQVGQSVARWHLMSVLSDGPRTVASTARRLGLARQSVQRVANDLVAEGLVLRSPNPADARSPLFRLTDSGAALVVELYGRSDAARADLVARAGITERQLDAARATIRALVDRFTEE